MAAQKDEDGLQFAVEVGLFSEAEARLIRATAASAVDDLLQRRWPFDEATWSRLQPQQLLTPAKLPDGWDLG